MYFVFKYTACLSSYSTYRYMIHAHRTHDIESKLKKKKNEKDKKQTPRVKQNT